MPKNDTIFKRLEQSTEAERESICDILELKTIDLNNIEKISAEFRSVSGHSVANLFRDEHAYEYLDILKDTWDGVKDSKYIKPKVDLLKEMSLENRLEIVFDSILKNTKNTQCFKDEIIKCGKNATGRDALGSTSIGILGKFISLPVGVLTTVAGYVTVPSYQKSFLVVVKFIEIKRRLRAEEKLKD